MKSVKLEGNALEVATSRYLMKGEDWDACANRVAETMSAPEVTNKQKYKDAFYEMIGTMDFLPGGRILRNASRTRGSLFNCYHLPVNDSIEEIGQFMKDSLILWSEGGGVGSNFSKLRPRGDVILGKGGVSSGLVSFIEAADGVANTIESGGARRAAALAHVDVTHPEVMDFIDAKLVHGKLSHFNISVAINDEFIQAVESDSDWTFKFNQKEYGKTKARIIWDKIVDNMIKSAEPGLINWTNFQKNNSWYYDPVLGTNPCHTGDSIVAVADGRNHVSFKELEKEGKDVPVFSLNDKTGNVEVKMMRNPRKTGYKQKIYKVYLDNEMYFRTNGVHKITLFDGTEKQVKDLKPNDRLHHMVKYNANLSTILNLKETKSDYVWISNGYQKNNAEHRIVAEYLVNRKLTKKEVVHHKDFDYQNNSPENLEVMLKTEHDSYHGDRIRGDNNPMRKFPEKNYFNNHKFFGLENGNSSGYTIEDLLEKAILFIKSIKRRPLMNEWIEYCKDNNLPFWHSGVYNVYQTHRDFLDEACNQTNVLNVSSYKTGLYKKYLKIKDETDLEVFWEDEQIKVIKICEICGEQFTTIWNNREIGLCSPSCVGKHASNKYQEQRNKAAVNDLNFKVTRIEEDGYEDVYNGTVDDNHNFYVFVGENETKNGKQKLNYINSRNCGETCLSAYDVCDLGSLVLPNFITGSVNTNWIKLENTIKTAVRFLDNVIQCNKYVMQNIENKANRSRRIGIGVLGVAEYLFAKKVRYGSERSIQELERLMQFIRNKCYEASVELAAEKGAFPAFDPILFGKSSFIRKLPASLRLDIKKHGIRNVSIQAIAPTGTISLLTNYTSSAEPLFAKAYERKDRVSNRIYIHPMYEKMIKNGEEIPEWFVDSFDLKPQDHFNVQAVIQKYVDSSVSKTINLPRETTSKDLSQLLLENIIDLKGVTVYRDGCRGEQPLNQITKEQAIEHIKKSIVKNTLEVGDVTCASGKCDL